MATEYAGYMGKILLVDLTMETAEEYPWTDDQRRQTLGGKAAALEILSKHLTGKEQPFSEENWVIFSTGPLTGTGAPGSDRFEITTLSPKTGTVASSNCGGKFGVSLKKAGLDGLILSGRCTGPSWLEINETGVFFHDAHSLWGLGTIPCTKQLDALLYGKAHSSVCIGPAGEELLPCATIVSDGRSAGRTGFGAVLGWKGVKAITVSGNQEIPIYDQSAVKAFICHWNRIIADHPLTADPSSISSCSGCPIRCKKKEAAPESWLNDLGLDSLEAENFRPWLAMHGVALSEGLQKKKHSKRRDKLSQLVPSQLDFLPAERRYLFFKEFTEALSAMGLCIFTVSTCIQIASADIFSIDPTVLLRHVSGFSLSTDQLLSIGRRYQEYRKSSHNTPSTQQ